MPWLSCLASQLPVAIELGMVHVRDRHHLQNVLERVENGLGFVARTIDAAAGSARETLLLVRK